MTRYIGVQEFDHLVIGAQLGVLAATNTVPGVLEAWVRDLLDARGPVELVDPRAVDQRFGHDAQGVAIGLVGSLMALRELPLGGDEPALVVSALAELLDTEFAVVTALNAAGPNALLVVAAASLLGLPLLDCDGQGRVMPLIDQTTYYLGGISPAPLATIGPWGDLVVARTPHHRAEGAARSAVLAAGGWVLSATYPSLARDLARTGIHGALSRCVESGRILDESNAAIGERLSHRLGGQFLGRGRIVDITLHARGASHVRLPADPLSILIESDAEEHQFIRLIVRNEVVLATVDGHVAAVAPDTVGLVDPFRRRAVDLLDLAVGDILDVLVFPARPPWHSPAGRALAGPSAFGLDFTEQEETR